MDKEKNTKEQQKYISVYVLASDVFMEIGLVMNVWGINKSL